MAESKMDVVVPIPNTPEHEDGLATFGKALAHVSMDICEKMLRHAGDRLEESPEDPLSCERYVHVANQLSEIATRMYELAENANSNLLSNMQNGLEGLK